MYTTFQCQTIDRFYLGDKYLLHWTGSLHLNLNSVLVGNVRSINIGYLREVLASLNLKYKLWMGEISGVNIISFISTFVSQFNTPARIYHIYLYYKACLHYQSLCVTVLECCLGKLMDCKKCLKELTWCLTLSSLKHFLQILQNLEFTYAKFLLWSQKLWWNQA